MSSDELKSKAKEITNLTALLAGTKETSKSEEQDRLLCKSDRESISIKMFSNDNVPMYSSSFVSAQMSLSAFLFISFASCVIEGVVKDSKFLAGDVCVTCDSSIDYDGPALLYRDSAFGTYYIYKLTDITSFIKPVLESNVTVYSSHNIRFDEVELLKETFGIKANTYYVESYK